jgi:outer membrane protein OmpA-like peptidoglycan-associated protein
MRQAVLTVILLFIFSNSSFSQGYNNRWSIELNPGVSNAVKPYTPGYWSNTIGLYHISGGTRFMFNNKYGLKWDIGFDRIRHDKTSWYNNTGVSQPFTSYYARTSVQFVLDIGRLLQFENFSEKTSLLFHTGGGMSWLWSKVNPETDKMVNFMFGLAPQFKVNERFSITTDVSFVWHIYQQYTWDMKNSVFNRGFDGFYANGTIGLNFYLGKYGSHMDWAFTPCFPDMTYLEDENKNLDSLNKQLQSSLRDDDGDGVANFMDDENNTLIGNIVNKRGVSLKNIDTDGDGVSDLIDKCIDIPGTFENEGCPQDLLLAIRNNEKDRVITNNLNGNPDNSNSSGQNGSDSLPNNNNSSLIGTNNGQKDPNELLNNNGGQNNNNNVGQNGNNNGGQNGNNNGGQNGNNNGAQNGNNNGGQNGNNNGGQNGNNNGGQNGNNNGGQNGNNNVGQNGNNNVGQNGNNNVGQNGNNNVGQNGNNNVGQNGNNNVGQNGNNNGGQNGNNNGGQNGNNNGGQNGNNNSDQNGNNNAQGNGNNQNNNSNPNVVTSREGLSSLVDVHFMLNESSIQSNLYPLLNEIVALLKANPGSSIVLEGHADATGEDEFNQLLSQKRTESLRKYMISQGIDPNRVQTGSFGESRPKFLNTTPKGRALNRRVEVYFKI